jgi:hypothetical protein
VQDRGSGCESRPPPVRTAGGVARTHRRSSCPPRPGGPPTCPPPGAVKYLAERYQLEVSDEYLRRRARDGTIAHTRLSRNKLLFTPADLDAWVQRSHVAAQAS